MRALLVSGRTRGASSGNAVVSIGSVISPCFPLAMVVVVVVWGAFFEEEDEEQRQEDVCSERSWFDLGGPNRELDHDALFKVE